MATESPAAPAAEFKGGRKNYLVDLRFQLKYTALLVLFGGTIMGLWGGAVWREARNNSELLEGGRIAAGLGMGGADRATLNAWGARIAELHEEVIRTDQRMLFVIVGTALVVMAGLGLCGVLLTHRVAGPLLVLDRYTSALGDGTFPKIRALRKKDELQAYFQAFQTMVEKLRQRQQEELAAIEGVVAQLDKAQSPGTSEAREALAALAQKKRQSLET